MKKIDWMGAELIKKIQIGKAKRNKIMKAVLLAIEIERRRAGEILVKERLIKELEGKADVLDIEEALTFLKWDNRLFEPREGFYYVI